METEKVAPKYFCEKCGYKTDKKSSWKKHLSTHKHMSNFWKHLETEKVAPIELNCETCNLVFKSRSGLWKHKKICIYIPSTESSINLQDPGFILKILEQNQQLQTLMKEQQDKHHDEVMKLIPKVGNNNNNFNLNIFLNEQCKDAINWDEFIKSIEVGMNDMNHAIGSDITKGVAKVICDGINKLGVYKRPIHCLDVKRKKLCIKNEDVWEKDSKKIDTTIDSGNRKVQQEHVKFIQEWQEQHTGWEKNSKLVEIYTIMVSKLMRDVEFDKCVTEISKNTIIPKDIIEA